MSHGPANLRRFSRISSICARLRRNCDGSKVKVLLFILSSYKRTRLFTFWKAHSRGYRRVVCLALRRSSDSLIADLRPRFSFNFEAVVISEVPLVRLAVLFCLVGVGRWSAPNRRRSNCRPEPLSPF